MIRVALCGDLGIEEFDLAGFFESYGRSCHLEDILIDRFARSDELLVCCEQLGEDAPFDLVLLPSTAGAISGESVTAELREIGLLDDGLQVVIVATDAAGAYGASLQGATGYLVRPVDELQARRVLGTMLQRIADQHGQSAIIRCRDRARRVDFSKITYVETSGHDQLIHRVGIEEPLTVRQSSLELFACLGKDRRFFKVGSSFGVNLDYVSSCSLRSGALVLTDGQQIPVPVRVRSKLAEALCSRAVLTV